MYKGFSTNTVYSFLSNNFRLEALTIAELYRERWQIELFFKWIKQHLHIKTHYGTTQNAMFTRIWIAISDYLLLIIAKKHNMFRFIKTWQESHKYFPLEGLLSCADSLSEEVQAEIKNSGVSQE